MDLIDPEGEEKGKEAEGKFKEWLEKHRIPYLYIKQDIDAFSSVFKEELKRPDFIILLPNLGFILVDVKYKKSSEREGTFPLDMYETRKFSSLQRKFNMPTWYVISNRALNYKTWFWIPISKVFEEGKYRRSISSKSRNPFFAVPIKEFIQLSDDDSLGRLFSKSF